MPLSHKTDQMIQLAVTVIGASLEMGANVGLDLSAVSQAIQLAESQGKTLTADQLKQFIDQWHASDKREQSAYDDRVKNN